MAFPADKETFPRRDTNDIIPKEDNNLPVDFLERLQDTLGYGADTPFPLNKAIFFTRLYVGLSATRYCLYHMNGVNLVDGEFPVITSGKLKNLYARMTSTMASGASITITVYKNGSPTSITLTFTDADTTVVKGDTVNEVSVVAGDLITVKAVETLGVNPASYMHLTFALK